MTLLPARARRSRSPRSTSRSRRRRAARARSPSSASTIPRDMSSNAESRGFAGSGHSAVARRQRRARVPAPPRSWQIHVSDSAMQTPWLSLSSTIGAPRARASSIAAAGRLPLAERGEQRFAVPITKVHDDVDHDERVAHAGFLLPSGLPRRRRRPQSPDVVFQPFAPRRAAPLPPVSPLPASFPEADDRNMKEMLRVVPCRHGDSTGSARRALHGRWKVLGARDGLCGTRRRGRCGCAPARRRRRHDDTVVAAAFPALMVAASCAFKARGASRRAPAGPRQLHHGRPRTKVPLPAFQDMYDIEHGRRAAHYGWPPTPRPPEQ